MADINIQRKKSAPSPWLLVLLAAVALAVAAYFFLRPAAEEAGPAPAAEVGAIGPDTLAAGRAAAEAAMATAAADSTAPAEAAPQSLGTDAATPSALGTLAAGNPAAPNYARNNLQKLTEVLVALADRDDLRDPSILEQRDNLTSATYRLNEPNTSLRPGFVAAVGLIRAMQQKAYPEMEDAANDLVRMGGQLTGRSNTPAEQQQNQQFFTRAAETVSVLSEPAK